MQELNLFHRQTTIVEVLQEYLHSFVMHLNDKWKTECMPVKYALKGKD